MSVGDEGHGHFFATTQGPSEPQSHGLDPPPFGLDPTKGLYGHIVRCPYTTTHDAKLIRLVMRQIIARCVYDTHGKCVYVTTMMMMMMAVLAVMAVMAMMVMLLISIHIMICSFNIRTQGPVQYMGVGTKHTCFRWGAQSCSVYAMV